MPPLASGDLRIQDCLTTSHGQAPRVLAAIGGNEKKCRNPAMTAARLAGLPTSPIVGAFRNNLPTVRVTEMGSAGCTGSGQPSASTGLLEPFGQRSTRANPSFSSVLRSIAWPLVSVAVVIILRRPLAGMLTVPWRRLKIGPVILETCDQQMQEVRRLSEVKPATRIGEHPAVARIEIAPTAGMTLGS